MHSHLPFRSTSFSETSHGVGEEIEDVNKHGFDWDN